MTESITGHDEVEDDESALQYTKTCDQEDQTQNTNSSGNNMVNVGNRAMANTVENKNQESNSGEDLIDFTINLTKYSNKNQNDESKSGGPAPVERTDWLEQYAEMTYSDQQDKSINNKEPAIVFSPPNPKNQNHQNSNSLSPNNDLYNIENCFPQIGAGTRNEREIKNESDVMD